MNIRFLGSMGGAGWYTMSWHVNDERVVSFDVWYYPIDHILTDFIEKSGLEYGTVDDVKEICENVISSLEYCEREQFVKDMYLEELQRKGDNLYLNIYNRLHPKTQKEPLIRFE